jgi:uncharacterized membrane protein
MNTFDSIIHVIHILASGVWLGGLVFTTVVISPAFRRMTWSPQERVAVRSQVGRQYSKVARFNLTVLLLAALGDNALRGWSTLSVLEITLIIGILLLSELHARVYAPRLGEAARSSDETARRSALRVSISISMLNLALSAVVAVLAI